MAEIRLLGPDDAALLRGVAEGLFDNAVDPVQARAFLASPLNLMALAMAGGEAVSFASGTILLHPDKAPCLFVNEVGTREAHRRRGLGAAVTRALLEAGRARGCDGAWLATEPGNAAARALYARLGGEAQMIVGYAWDGAFDR